MSEVTTDFPADAKILNADFDFDNNQVKLLVWSSMFDIVPDEQMLMDMDVIATIHLSELEAIMALVRPERSPRS